MDRPLQSAIKIQIERRNSSTFARQSYSISFDFPELNTTSFAGYTIGGILTKKETPKFQILGIINENNCNDAVI